MVLRGVPAATSPLFVQGRPRRTTMSVNFLRCHSGRAPLRRESRNPVTTGLLIRVIGRPAGLHRAALDAKESNPVIKRAHELNLRFEALFVGGMSLPLWSQFSC